MKSSGVSLKNAAKLRTSTSQRLESSITLQASQDDKSLEVRDILEQRLESSNSDSESSS
jgi:hypothetical protein